MKAKPTPITKPYFSPRARKLVDSFEGAEIHGKPKGASRTTRIINSIFCAITEEHNTDDPIQLVQIIRDAAQYFINTRGQMTPTITNAITLVLDGLEQHSSNVSDITTFVASRCEHFNSESIANLEQIKHHGATLLKDDMTIFVYDYSSTVAGIITHAGTLLKSLKIIIPESRALNGGIPIVKAAISSGHDVLYITDSAIGQQIPSAEAAFIGAESITNIGGCWNTTGSTMVALVAKHYNVPLYIPTELMKFDNFNPQGTIREAIWKDISAIKSNDPILLDKNVSVQSLDLDHVESELITAFVTEQGLLTPNKTVSAAKRLFS
jgi:ribose 1,5-bisphosphate isomerase